MTINNNTQKSSDFKFVVKQGNDIIVEKIFNADCFNPVIRYSVDIREIIPSITQRLQNVMSRRNLNYVSHGYNSLKYYKELIDVYNLENNKLVKPHYTKYTHNGKTIKGVECKFGLYINDNPIVERKIYVDNYNPACRFSTEIVELVNEIVGEIYESLKELDVDHMWGDYILLNTYGLFHNQIRELSKNKRNELVDNFNDKKYVKKYIASQRN